MCFSISLGLYFFCFFHLLCHALFKASLFIISGVIIHNRDSSQDFRNINVFSKFTPLLSSSAIICVLCLCGFPFLGGFFSKDLILDGVTLRSSFRVFFILSVFITISYSLRYCFYALFSSLGHRIKIYVFYETILFVLLPVWLLLRFAIFLGYVWFEMVGQLCVVSIFTSF